MRTITVKDLVEKYDIDLFDFEYALTQEQKEKFEPMVYRTYWFRNIGFETVDMFLWELETRVTRLANWYSKIDNALSEVDYELQRKYSTTETFTGESGSESTNENESDSTDFGVAKELGYVSIDDVDFDNVNSAVKNVNNLLASANSATNSNFSQTRVLENPELPVHEAINHLRSIKTDVLYEFVDELQDLFSLIYY